MDPYPALPDVGVLDRGRILPARVPSFLLVAGVDVAKCGCDIGQEFVVGAVKCRATGQDDVVKLRVAERS